MAVNRAVATREDRIVPATVLALGVHLIIIFGLGFSVDFSNERERASSVTFALTPAATAPDDARHTAADNQQGADDSVAANVRYPGATLSVAATETTDNGRADVTSNEPLSEQSRSLQQDVAALSDSAANSDPRAGAVAARRALDARYLLRWRQRVEQVGNALYRQATARYGSGDVRLRVIVAADGSLERVQVITPSGTPELDQAAITTVRRAAPFPAFPAELREKTARLEIIRTWQFRAQANERG